MMSYNKSLFITVVRGTMIIGKLLDFYKTVHVHLPLEGVFVIFGLGNARYIKITSRC